MSSPSDLKQAGNTLFSASKYADAMREYTKALVLLSTQQGQEDKKGDELPDDADTLVRDALAVLHVKEPSPASAASDQQPAQPQAQQQPLVVILHSNRAQCLLELHRHDKAALDAARAVLLSWRGGVLDAKATLRLIKALAKISVGGAARDALVACEVAVKRWPAADGVAAAFKEAHAELCRGGERSPALSTGAGDFGHFLNGAPPTPSVCYVCKADTMQRGADFRVAVECACRLVSYCCSAHSQVALADEHARVCRFGVAGEKRLVSRLIASSIGSSSSSGGGAAAAASASHQHNHHQHHHPNHDASPESALGSMQTLMNGFRASIGGNGEEQSFEFEQIRSIPRCVACGAHPVDSCCEGCGTVWFCDRHKHLATSTTASSGNSNDNDTAAATVAETEARNVDRFKRLHPVDVCRQLAVTRSCYHAAWRARSGCFPQLLSPPASSGGARASPGDIYAAVRAAGRGRAFEVYHELMTAAGGKRPAALHDATQAALSRDSLSWPLTIFAALFEAPAAVRSAIQARIDGAPAGGGAESKSKKNKKKQSKAAAARELLIHVVGSELEAAQMVVIWEELLHLFFASQQGGLSFNRLHLVMIGPEIPATLDGQTTEHLALCPSCKAAKREIFFSFARTTYEEFLQVQSHASDGDNDDLTAAPVVALFHPGLHNYVSVEQDGASWEPAVVALLDALQRKRTHLACVTSYERDEMELDRGVVLKLLKNSKAAGAITVTEPVENPFASPLLKLDVNYWSGRTYCQNNLMFLAY